MPTRKPTVTTTKAEVPRLLCDGPAAWEAWLSANHATSRGVWLQLAKKTAGPVPLTYAQALDGALAWGWIDAVKSALDDNHWLQKFTPRGARSMWSMINRDKVAVLLDAGRMQVPGLVEVERAKSDGRWDNAYASQKNITVPDDLAAALARNDEARAFFATLTGANRYAILFRIHHAKKPETRQKHIERFVAMLARHEKVHP
jgi:uncharacterized protein YdeI (YjbR/CyaY-like superfamily)